MKFVIFAVIFGVAKCQINLSTASRNSTWITTHLPTTTKTLATTRSSNITTRPSNITTRPSNITTRTSNITTRPSNITTAKLTTMSSLPTIPSTKTIYSNTTKTMTTSSGSASAYQPIELPETNCKILESEFGICEGHPVEGEVESFREVPEIAVVLEGGVFMNFTTEEPRQRTVTPEKVDETCPSETGTIGNLTASVISCKQICYTYYPTYVFVNGMWRKVVQLGGFRQSIRWCWCLNTHCSGKSYKCGYSWNGMCLKLRFYKRILIWTGGNVAWVWIPVESGCICTPFGILP